MLVPCQCQAIVPLNMVSPFVTDDDKYHNKLRCDIERRSKVRQTTFAQKRSQRDEDAYCRKPKQKRPHEVYGDSWTTLFNENIKRVRQLFRDTSHAQRKHLYETTKALHPRALRNMIHSFACDRLIFEQFNPLDSGDDRPMQLYTRCYALYSTHMIHSEANEFYSLLSNIDNKCATLVPFEYHKMSTTCRFCRTTYVPAPCKHVIWGMLMLVYDTLRLGNDQLDVTFYNPHLRMLKHPLSAQSIELICATTVEFFDTPYAKEHALPDVVVLVKRYVFLNLVEKSTETKWYPNAPHLVECTPFTIDIARVLARYEPQMYKWFDSNGIDHVIHFDHHEQAYRSNESFWFHILDVIGDDNNVFRVMAENKFDRLDQVRLRELLRILTILFDGTGIFDVYFHAIEYHCIQQLLHWLLQIPFTATYTQNAFTTPNDIITKHNVDWLTYNKGVCDYLAIPIIANSTDWPSLIAIEFASVRFAKLVSDYARQALNDMC